MNALAKNTAADPEREFKMGNGEFQAIAKAIYKHAGIVIDSSKRELVYSRMSRRLRALSLSDFSSYLSILEGAQGKSEIKHLINTLTTNHTRFFREPHHFQYMQETIIPYWKKRAEKTGNKRLRIWCAASSTGEEPYTLAMVIANGLKGSVQWDWKILATDIDTSVLAAAKKGIYENKALEEIPKDYRRSYINKLGDGQFEIKPELKRHLTFNRLNLHGAWPIKTSFDMIFCRNVFIYFDLPSKQLLVDRFSEVLSEEGWFFLGHSESILVENSPFKLVGRTIYEPSNVVRRL